VSEKKISEMTPSERVNLIDGEFPFCIDILKVIGSFLEDTDSSKWVTRHEESLSKMIAILYNKLAQIKEAIDINNQQLLDLENLRAQNKLNQNF
jgi:hypothetical protein